MPGLKLNKANEKGLMPQSVNDYVLLYACLSPIAWQIVALIAVVFYVVIVVLSRILPVTHTPEFPSGKGNANYQNM